MAVYQRNDSPFWWMLLEHSNIRKSTGIPIGDKHARKQSRADAAEIYRAAMGDLARGELRFHKRKPTISFQEWAIWYRDQIVVHHRGKRRATSIVTMLIAAFGDTPLHELTKERLEEWKALRAKIRAKSTVNRELDMLKPLLRAAVPKYLDASPADKVKRFRTHNPPIAILSEDAEARLLDVAGPAERAMLLLGLDALLRLGNVRTLHVDQDKGTHLELTITKTDPYKVPVSSRLRAALDVLAPKGGYYFPRWYRPRGAPREVPSRWGPMGEATAFHLFRAVCERAKVPAGREIGGITFHSLRHTGATRAARVVKLSVVKRLGGWKSLKQLDRYDHPDDPEIVRAVEAIGEAMRTNSEAPQPPVLSVAGLRQK